MPGDCIGSLKLQLKAGMKMKNIFKGFLCVLAVMTLLPLQVWAHGKNYCEACERDKLGHIKRDPRQTREFRKLHPCPSTGNTTGACPGYVIDHIVPLKRGGADRPENMQWQTKEEAKAKDKWE